MLKTRANPNTTEAIASHKLRALHFEQIIAPGFFPFLKNHHLEKVHVLMI